MGAKCCSQCSMPLIESLYAKIRADRDRPSTRLVETEALLPSSFADDNFDYDDHPLMTEDQIKELVDHQMALSAELNQQLEEEERALREEEEAYFQASRMASAKRKADALAKASGAPKTEEPRSSSFDEVTTNFGNFESQSETWPRGEQAQLRAEDEAARIAAQRQAEEDSQAARIAAQRQAEEEAARVAAAQRQAEEAARVTAAQQEAARVAAAQQEAARVAAAQEEEAARVAAAQEDAARAAAQEEAARVAAAQEEAARVAAAQRQAEEEEAVRVAAAQRQAEEEMAANDARRKAQVARVAEGLQSDGDDILFRDPEEAPLERAVAI